MAEALNNFDCGTNNTTITTSNSGGACGNAFDRCSMSLDGSPGIGRYTTAQSYQGGMAAEFSNSSTSTTKRAFVSYTTTLGTTSLDIWWRLYAYFTAYPTSGNNYYFVRACDGDDGTTTSAAIKLRSDGRVETIDKTFSTVATSPSGGGNLVALNTWVRFEGKFRFNDGDGHIELRYYATPEAAIGSFTWKLENFAVDCRTQATRYQMGLCNSVLNVPTFYLDAIEWDQEGSHDGNFNFIGPVSANSTISPSSATTGEAFGTPTVTGGVQPITATVTLENNSTSDLSSYSTASFTPAANKLILLTVSNGFTGGAGAVSSVTGNGLTWVEVNTITNSNHRTTIFRAMGANPTTGSITINFATGQENAAWRVVEFANVATGGTNGSAAVPQSKTNTGSTQNGRTVTLDNALGVGSATFGAGNHNSTSNAWSAGTGFTELGNQTTTNPGSPSTRLFNEWSVNGTHPIVADSAASASWAMIGLEIVPSNVVQTVSPSGIATAEAFGAPSVSCPKVHVFDGGTNGVTISVANSGGLSGNAWNDIPTPGTDATGTYSNVQSRSGLSSRFTTAGTASSFIMHWSDPLVSNISYGRLYYYNDVDPPSANRRLFLARLSGAGRESVQHRSTGKLRIETGAGAFQSVVESVNNLPANQWIRIEWKITYGPSGASPGSCELRYYNNPDSTTATETLTGSPTGGTAFFGEANEWRFGNTLNAANQGPFFLDDIGMRTNDFLGPVVHPGAVATGEAFGTPSVTISNNTVSPTGITSAEAFGQPTVSAGAFSVTDAGNIFSQEGFGTPTVVLNNLFPLSINSQEAFGIPAVVLSTINLIGIASNEAFGTPTVLNTITPTGIQSLESFGTPRVKLVNEYADSPWEGLTVLDVHSTAGSTFFSVSIADVDESAFGNQTPWEGAAGSSFLLRLEWIPSRSGVTPFPTRAVVSMRDVPAGNQISGSGWTVTAAEGFTGSTGVLTQLCHFDDTPLDGELTTIRAGLMEVRLYLENKVGTNPITWACDTNGLSTGTQPLAFNFARGELNGTIEAITPTGIGSAEAFGTPTITAVKTLLPSSINSLETFGTAAVNVSGVLISAPSIPSEETFGTPTVSGPNHFLTLTVSARGVPTQSRSLTLKRILETNGRGVTSGVFVTARSRTLITRTRGRTRGVLTFAFENVTSGGNVIIKKVLAMFGD